MTGNTDPAYIFFFYKHAQASTSALSVPQIFYPNGMRPGFDFGALGIYNAPTWGVQLPDGSGGTQVVQVPRAPVVEGLPLPLSIQVASFMIINIFVNMALWLVLNRIFFFFLKEPHKSAYEYLFELVAALKHMITRRVSYMRYDS